MKNKKFLICVLLVSILILSGCAVKDYLQRYIVTEQPANYTLLSEKEEYVDELNETEELLNETEELEASVEDMDETIEEEPTRFDKRPQIRITVEENDSIILKPEAEDADLDPIIYTFTNPLNEEGAWKTNFGDAGKYIVTVTASDGELTTSKEVLIEVLRKNVPPVIEGIPDSIAIDEGDTIKMTPNVTDPNGDDFTLEISDPVGDDGIWETGYTDHDVYIVTLTASDGELESVHEMELIVNRKNIAPIIEPIADIVIKEGEKVEIEPIVTDLNEDDVEVHISDPVGDDGEWETVYTDHGEYSVTVSASDGELESVVIINLVVEDVNMAPVILNITNIG